MFKSVRLYLDSRGSISVCRCSVFDKMTRQPNQVFQNVAHTIAVEYVVVL